MGLVESPSFSLSFKEREEAEDEEDEDDEEEEDDDEDFVVPFGQMKAEATTILTEETSGDEEEGVESGVKVREEME